METEPNEPINPSIVKVKCDYAGNKTAEAMLPEFENKQLVGMTKREYFAAMALNGMLAYTPERDLEHAATLAAKQADALISALNK